MSQITDLKLPKWFTNHPLQKDDLIQREDGNGDKNPKFRVYESQGKLIYICEPQLTNIHFFALTIITQDQFLNSYSLCQK